LDCVDSAGASFIALSSVLMLAFHTPISPEHVTATLDRSLGVVTNHHAKRRFHTASPPATRMSTAKMRTISAVMKIMASRASGSHD